VIKVLHVFLANPFRLRAGDGGSAHSVFPGFSAVRTVLLIGMVAILQPDLLPGASESRSLRPVPGTGFRTRVIGGRLAAMGLLADAGFIASVVLEGKFLKLEVMVDNLRGPSLVVQQGDLQIQGVDAIPIHPLNPRRFVQLKYGVDPIELDGDGHPLEPQATGFRIEDDKAGQAAFSETLEEQDAQDQQYEAGLAAAQEMFRILKGHIYRGGAIQPGEKSLETLIFQQDHISWPMTCTVRLRGESIHLVFDSREEFR